MLNLLSNAIKFTDQGDIDVMVRVRSLSDNLTYRTVFEVSDSGIGIAEDKQEMIFESFTQVDGSVARRHGGTGLGLAISRRLCDLMGGKLEVESRAGQGSTFTLTLLLSRASETEERLAA